MQRARRRWQTLPAFRPGCGPGCPPRLQPSLSLAPHPACHWRYQKLLPLSRTPLLPLPLTPLLPLPLPLLPLPLLPLPLLPLPLPLLPLLLLLLPGRLERLVAAGGHQPPTAGRCHHQPQCLHCLNALLQGC